MLWQMRESNFVLADLTILTQLDQAMTLLDLCRYFHENCCKHTSIVLQIELLS